MQSNEFEEFYDRALPVVFGYFVTRCGGRKDVAEELTQETFLSAVQSLERGVDIESQLPWIVSIARRRLVDHFRKQERRERSEVEIRSPFPSSTSVGGSALTSLTEARLIAALDRVPPRQRIALLLRYVDDLTVREVARSLNQGESATESLIRRGRASLLDAYLEVDID